jgi:hypothetical protein
VVLTFSSQLFAVGKADLTDEAKENLQEAAVTLAEYPDADVEIEGHTDSTGSAKLNLELSENRAKNVMSFLIEKGISEKRLSAVGYGKDRPIADNGTDEGRATNRRVELVVKVKEPEPEPELVVEEKKEEKEGIRFGVRAGVNLLKVYDFWDEPELDDNMDIGWAFGAGLAVNIPLTSHLSLSPELALYYRNLFRFEHFSDNVKQEMYIYEFAVSIPVLLKLTPVKSIPFYLAAGIQVDIPLLTEITWKGSSELENGLRFEVHMDWVTNPMADHRTIDFGIALGLGYMITPNLGVDFRGVIGMKNLFEKFTAVDPTNGVASQYEDDTSSLMQFGLGVSYFF